MRRRRRRQRRKGRGPPRPRVAGGVGGHHALAIPLPEQPEALELGKDIVAAPQQMRDGPATPEGPGPHWGPGKNAGGSPQGPSRDLEEGASCEGEQTTAQPEMEEGLEKAGHAQKQPLESQLCLPRPARLGVNSERCEGGPMPPGGEATGSPQGSMTPARPSTQSPLVLSLFYCPSEEEEDGDWPSEDEGGCSGADWTDSEEEPEKDMVLWGSPSRGQDPLNPLHLAMAPVSPSPPRPKDRELWVSSYLHTPDLEMEKWGDPWRPPEKPWPMRQAGPRQTPGCKLGSPGAEDPAMAQALDLPCDRAKKVRFSPVVTVHPLVVWSFASRAARRGPWEELARDRDRFCRRIKQLGAILGPCLEPAHRARVWSMIHGPAEEQLPFPHPGAQGIPLPVSSEGPGVRDGRLG
ncbi:protein phosphatase 1 regulatory subunit 15A [Carettochelys insculpta]|uniref:protein phosphatase 1 regulatory subunit 15A n=1 Tax=Carettochelys insculpta TaxID=44489 RepID=UPI003EBCCC33